MQTRTFLRQMWQLALFGIASAGLRLDRLADQQWRRHVGATGLVLHVLVFSALVWVNAHIPDRPGPLLATFIIGWAAYTFGNALILGLRSRGRLRVGNDDQAFARYEVVAALMFQLQAMALYQATRLSWAEAGLMHGDPLLRLHSVTVYGLALPMIAIGLVTKLWALMVTGIDTYFYRDMFLGRASPGGWVARGPYRWLQNPMYGVGYLHGYGLALIAQSTMAVVAVAICQLSIYAFYFALEHPFIVRVYSAKANATASVGS